MIIIEKSEKDNFFSPWRTQFFLGEKVVHFIII